jgi:aspartyl-tRNA(Asn)/glutamyl-tRNA(Gln) amidotransferase subunit C
MITKEEATHIADLARIGTDEKDIEKMSEDLSAILDWMKELEKADVEKVEPTEHITGLENRSREDSAREFGNKKEIVKLFPEEKGGYDKVRSVL